MDISHIEESILKAARHESKLTPMACSVPSFTGIKVRHLLNNLGSALDVHYLEIGVHKGGTFVATNYENRLMSSIAVDNWSEFAEGGLARQEFLRHTKELLDPSAWRVLERDCWTLTREDLPNPINLYLYDGNHSVASHEKALTYFYDVLADPFVLLVDDFSWPRPKVGTRAGLSKANLKVLYERELYTPPGQPERDHWWNGLYVALLKK